MPTAAVATYPGVKLEPYLNPEQARMIDVAFVASQFIQRGTVLGQVTASGLFAPYWDGLADGSDVARLIAVYDMVIDANGNVIYSNTAGTNEVQTVTITGGPTGGTFTLTFRGQTTGGIAFNATAAAVRTALAALTTIGSTANVNVAGTGPYTVTFQGALGGQDVPAMTASGTGLTGGTTPAAAVTTTTAGAIAPVSGNEQGLTSKAAPAYYCGTFLCADLVGLDANGLADLQGHLLAGTVTTGIMRFG